MKKTVNLVSVSFPGRDLCLAPVSIKSIAMNDKEVTSQYEITISQYDLDTSIDDAIDDLCNCSSDIYGFTTYVWNIQLILELAKRLKARVSDSLILLGGPEASGMAKKIMEKYDFVDLVFVGEGEISFRAFLLGEEYKDIPGLVYRDGHSIHQNQEPEFVDLNTLFLPYESEDYRRYLHNSPSTVRAAIETSRGCPFNCGYCTWGQQKMRYFSLEKLEPAFKFLFEHPKVRTVYITDSNPFLRRKRTIKLIEMLIKHNVHKKSVTFELSPEYISDERVLELLPKLYNDEFALGVQSTSPKVLDLMGRKFDPEKYRSNILLMKEKNPNVRLWFSLIIGLPGDNYSQFIVSLDFVINLKPEGIYVHELLCLPGSDFYKYPEKYGIEFMDEAPHKILKNESFPQEEYDRAKFLSYFVYLVHRTVTLRDQLFNLMTSETDLRLIDYYIKFAEFVGKTLDVLNGTKIEDVTSWFFEKIADSFLSRDDNVQRLQSIFNQFVLQEVKQ